MTLSTPQRIAFTPREIADMSGVTYQQVMTAIGTGQLAAKRKTERTYLVLLKDAEAWLESLPDA